MANSLTSGQRPWHKRREREPLTHEHRLVVLTAVFLVAAAALIVITMLSGMAASPVAGDSGFSQHYFQMNGLIKWPFLLFTLLMTLTVLPIFFWFPYILVIAVFWVAGRVWGHFHARIHQTMSAHRSLPPPAAGLPAT